MGARLSARSEQADRIHPLACCWSASEPGFDNPLRLHTDSACCKNCDGLGANVVYGEIVRAELQLQKGTLWLDAGGGAVTGVSGLASRAGRRCKLVVVDLYAGALAENWCAYETIQADLSAIPISDGSIDIVTLRWVIEHLREPREAIAELSRVLSDCGTLILLTPNALHYNAPLAKALPTFYTRIIRKRWFGARFSGRHHFYDMNTRARILQAMTENGLREKQFLYPPKPVLFPQHMRHLRRVEATVCRALVLSFPQMCADILRVYERSSDSDAVE